MKHHVCVEDGSLWESCQCSSPPFSLCTPPVTRHTAHLSVELTHAHPATVHGMLRCPFPPKPPHPHAVPPRSPAAQLVRDPRCLAGVRGTCGQLPYLPARRPPRRCMWVRSARIRSCSSRLRRGGTSSLPQAHSGENGARAAAMWASVGVVCLHRRAACGQVTTGLGEDAFLAIPKAATHLRFGPCGCWVDV